MNKRNYQKELDLIIEKNMREGKVPRLLLHACCAPCSSYCLEYLAHYFEITVLYYNPNIQPKDEYEKRVKELFRLVKEMTEAGVLPSGRVKAVEGKYEPQLFEEMAKGLEEVPEGGSRCYKCYELRLKEAARYAKEHGFEYFTTTLSISPLKNPVWINEIGERLADEYEIMHLPSEFRKKGGYQRSIQLSQEYSLYRQNFCGCIYSQHAAEALTTLSNQKIIIKSKEFYMKTLLERLAAEVGSAFEKAGYKPEMGKVTISNRPDLCEYQCNGAMAGAKEYHKAPIMIANDVAAALADTKVFESVEAVNPGFLNLKLNKEYLAEYLNESMTAPKFGANEAEAPQTIMVDYGGPNVAKPLHVGHLRAAIIGESVKRICAFKGHKTIGDIHMGDWGLQMGLIIHELSLRKPELPYFDKAYEGEYPKEAPFTLSELEEIYPCASGKSKEDEAYKAAAMDATYRLQHGDKGCLALWQHIMNISVADLKRNYENLNVHFELWKGEADADKYIPEMVENMKKGGYLYESEGALVVDVKEESDTKEIPPCMILKSDGASLYTTTDLATLVQRQQDYNPDRVIYVVDKRQELHFDQVFRTAKKTGIVDADCDLKFIGFGTMNGKDGKPFKTREGGVMRLERLIADINEQMLQKMRENRQDTPEEEARETAKTVGLAAIKYGDLSNQATKDYVFDPDRFTSFEGDTGPYILYTIVRIKSILAKYTAEGGTLTDLSIKAAVNDTDKELQKALAGFVQMIDGAYDELAPHRICAYIYDAANAFNRFYHETKILGETDENVKKGFISLLVLTRDILECCIELLGFSAPERM